MVETLAVVFLEDDSVFKKVVQAASGAAAAAAASADEPPPLQVLRLRKLARFYISIADGECSVERDFAFLREELQQGPTLGC